MNQYDFIEKMINLYLDFPTNKEKMIVFFKELDFENSSESNFYNIIFKILKEKTKIIMIDTLTNITHFGKLTNNNKNLANILTTYR